MKTNHFLYLLVALVTFFGLTDDVHAQQYKTDALLADSVELYSAVSKGEGVFIRKKDKILVPNGEVVELVPSTGNEVVVRYKDADYVVDANDLRFGKNEKGVKNTIQDEEQQRKHTFFGHMFYSSFPYVLVFIILVVTGICMLLVNKFVKSEPLVSRLLTAVPLGLMFTSLLELWAYLTIGSDINWWCDPGRHTIGHSLLMAAPLSVALAIQVLVGMSYKRYVDSVAEVEVPWKIMGWGIGLFIPLSLVVLLVLHAVPMGAFLRGFLAVVLLLCIVGLCFGYSLHRITKALGKRRAMLFTCFSFVYAISLVVATVIFFIIALKIILIVASYFVVIAVAIYLLAMAGGWAAKKKKEEKAEEKATDAAGAGEKKIEEKKDGN